MPEEPQEILPELPPPEGEPKLDLPWIDLTAGTGPIERPPIRRPPIEGPELPPIPFPREKRKSILELIQEWFRNLPNLWKVLLVITLVAVLIYLLVRFFSWLYRKIKPPGLTPPDEEAPYVVPIAIWFNYDTSVPIALNIRRNAKEEVRLPEWTLEEIRAEESPAAYSISASQGQTVKIMVKLIMVPAIDAVVEVRGTNGDVLGEATRDEPVRFAKGVTIPEFVEFELKNHSIGNAGVRKSDISWQWEFRLLGESAWHVIGQTHHRIYEVLTTPGLPWKQDPFPESQNVWTEVLEYACEWASGEKTPEGIAEKVTIEVNKPAGGVKYNEGENGKCKYTSGYMSKPGRFNCTEYLKRLNGLDAPEVVNCSDCSAFVSTFANAAGTNLSQSPMGNGFELNKIAAIGLGKLGNPDWETFWYHEVAWWAGGGAGDEICDACLKTNKNGPDKPETAVLHTNSKFSDPYRPQLAAPAGIDKCKPMPGFQKWRKVR